MTRTWSGALLGASLLAAGACADLSGPRGAALSADALTAAFATVPVGYGDLSSSYVGTPAAGFDGGSMWLGGGREAHMGRGDMMGGGLADPFVGGIAFNRGDGGHHGPFGGGLACAGTFNATTNRVECPTETRNGLTIARSAQYLSASGAVQQAFDSLTTNTVNLRTSVSGTVTFDSASHGPGPMGGPGGHHHDGGWGMGRGPGGLLLGDTARILTATTTIASASDRTTAGLAATGTQRTTSGTSAGSEQTTGTTTRGAFTATRTVGDTTTGLVIPKPTTDDAHPYPTAGTVVRAMAATLAYAGQPPVSLTRREVVTYDGSATAKVTITENGTTRTCTRPLPRGPLSCS